MQNAVRDFPNKAIISIATDIMCDKYCSKLLYYTKDNDKDIYNDEECLPLENPIKELKNVKVFMNRKVDRIFIKDDIGLFVTLYRLQPYRLGGVKKAKYIGQAQIEIGVVCGDGCRDTVNGQRDVAIISRIVSMFCNTEKQLDVNVNYKGIGEYSLYSVSPLYDMPSGFTGYQILLNVENLYDK